MSVRYLLGQAGAADVVAAVQTTLWETREAMRRLPGIGTVLLVSENSVYRIPGRVRTETFHDRKPTWVLTREASGLPRLLIRLRQLAATHLVVNLVRDNLVGPVRAQYQYYPWDDRQLGLLRDLMHGHARLVLPPAHVDGVNGGFYVWRLDRRPASSADARVLWLPGIQEVASRLYRPWFERQDYAGSYALALYAMRLYPDVAWFGAQAGFIAHQIGRHAEAYRLLGDADRAGFIGDHTQIFLGAEALACGHPAEAIAILRRARALFPDQRDQVRPVLAGACAAEALRLCLVPPVPPGALRLARLGATLDPANVSVQSAVGNVLLGLGRPDEAEAVFRMVMARWPQDPRAQDVGRKNLALCAEVRRAAGRR
jgi:tetratricopeptide (TPR) repeat protein